MAGGGSRGQPGSVYNIFSNAHDKRAMDDNHTVTLHDIAAAAGVSVATASRVLNGDDRVGAERRASVLQAAGELGYVANRAARSLRTRRSGTIAVVLAEESTIVFG